VIFLKKGWMDDKRWTIAVERLSRLYIGLQPLDNVVVAKPLRIDMKLDIDVEIRGICRGTH
jgi:hypothetical protein